tara:strand:- start:20 stop:1159 length:1140 start_codon:yes stop_codon:yes gene_type:complete
MAEADITSAGTGDWNAGATWTGGAVPDTDQHAIIQSGHNVTINANDEIKSLTVNSGGTLTGNASYSLTINGEGSASYGTNYQCVYIRGVIGANVNLIITTGVSTEFDTNSSSGRLTNLTISNTSGQVSWEAGMSISGDLVVSASGGNFRPYNMAYPLTVDGDVTVNGTLVHSGDVPTGAFTFGSLTINSGGTFRATSGTTTITDGATIGGTASMAFGGEGTFTHNNGTLVLDSTDHRIPKGGTFYNLTLNGEQSTDGIYCYTSTMLPQGIMPDGTTGASYFSILGTLQINNDEFRPYLADKIYIHNLIIGDGTGSANTAKFDMSEADEFDGTVFVDNVTINSDGQLLFGDGAETSATVGSSALNIYGAFRNIGGSVDIT